MSPDVDNIGFLEHPEKDWEVAIEEARSNPSNAEWGDEKHV